MAQNRPAPAPVEVPVAPIECWWKTDRSAVRVGETFSLTLTCAVLDSERAKVAVDESSLSPTALHLVPFEIVGGQRFRDVLNSPRKFFQYQYTMRILGEEFFGKEVTLPRLQISYRVQNSLSGGSALAGREQQYSLRPVPIRVLSLVPAGTVDIRDTPADTFGDVDTRLFRSNLFLIGGAVAFGLAALGLVMLLARAAIKRRATAAVRKLAVSPGTLLRTASRELKAVQSASQREGWTSELAGRAASALRLAGAVALEEPVSQKEVSRSDAPREGQIVLSPGLHTLKGRRVVVSAAVTPVTRERNGRGVSQDLWDALSRPLGVFTAAHYSRNGTLDGVSLETALSEGHDALRRLRFSQWRRIGRSRRRDHEEAAKQAWAR